MAAKKKSKKVTKPKSTSPKKAAKSAPKRKAAKKATGKKITAKKKAATNSPKKTAMKVAKKAAVRKPSRKKAQVLAVFDRDALESGSIAESGDLQGLSGLERADSESVEELIEEGNAFEAGIVAGVEEAEDDSEREVHTHEVPEDDVPGEYQDEDR